MTSAHCFSHLYSKLHETEMNQSVLQVSTSQVQTHTVSRVCCVLSTSVKKENWELRCDCSRLSDAILGGDRARVDKNATNSYHSEDGFFLIGYFAGCRRPLFPKLLWSWFWQLLVVFSFRETRTWSFLLSWPLCGYHSPLTFLEVNSLGFCWKNIILPSILKDVITG